MLPCLRGIRMSASYDSLACHNDGQSLCITPLSVAAVAEWTSCADVSPQYSAVDVSGKTAVVTGGGKSALSLRDSRS